MEKYILKRPIEYKGETITELNMDLDGLNRPDMDKAEDIVKAQLGKKASPTHIWTIDKNYQMCIAAMSAGVPLEALDNLGGKDYMQIRSLVQNFLLDGDSESEEEAFKMMEEYLAMSGRTKVPLSTASTPTETPTEQTTATKTTTTPGKSSTIQS